MSSSIAKPVARVTPPAPAPATESNEPVTAESLGWQLRSALPPMRLHSVSLYNTDADVLWLSEGALGPDEHNVVIEAIEGQKADTTQAYYEYGMEDGRMAVFLPIRGPRGDLAGTVMILAEMKSLNEGTMERIVTPQIRTILVKIAMFMRKSTPVSAEAAAEVAMPAPAATPAPVNLTSTTVIEKLPAAATAAVAAAAAPTLDPREVEQILELELVAEPPRATPAASAPAASATSAPLAVPAGTALRKNKPGQQAADSGAPALPKAALRAGGSPATFPSNGVAQGGAAGASTAAARNSPTLTSVPVPKKGMPPAQSANSALGPAVPLRGDVEVLQFDANISVPTVKPAAAPLPDIEVLAFEPDIQVPTAKAPDAAPADIEVLSFDAEPPVVTAAPVPQQRATQPKHTAHVPPRVAPVAKAIPTVSPTAKSAETAAGAHAAPASSAAASSGSTSSVRVFKAAPQATVPPAATPSPPPKAPPATNAAQTAGAAAASSAAPVAKAPPSSTAQTAAVPVVTDDDEDSQLINDTGNMPKLLDSAKLLDTTTIEPAPQLPPLEPLSVAESATDLTLFAQELIKLRSNGRTRRYEVLARSQRDAHRNEVPAAFVAESARGKDGSALDSMVVERLLIWLGKHGEAIWDSEPASFSVNLSIGAIEDESFPQRVQEWMDKNNVPAEYVGFEINEFACVQCKPAVQRFVEAIEKMGCFLVIDNFSLDSDVFEFLGSKALRHVKLDPKLTAAAMKEKLPQALVVAILQACKVLGVHCVAKRVESQSSMQWLTAVGCDFAQSFSLHKPLPLDSLASGAPIKALRE